MHNQSENELYTIPPNFIGTGTIFGGMFKLRNVLEAGVLACAIGLPELFLLPFSLTTRIIIFCLTALPLAMLAVIGISSESLSTFAIIYIKYLRNRRVLGAVKAEMVPVKKSSSKRKNQYNYPIILT